jgi:S1-C subfamily serine protease
MLRRSIEMSDRVKTRRRVLIIVGIVALACVALGLAAAAAGGAVYALTRETDWLRPWTEGISLPLASQEPAQDEERGIVVPLAADEDEQGIVVAAVVDDGPAAAAGLKRGDILLELDGTAIDSYTDLRQALQALAPGDEVELRVLHGDDERRLTATLDERDGQAFLGVVPCCVIREDDVTLRTPQRILAGGALITDVVDDSPADEAGLEAGHIVLAVDGEELGDELTLAEAITAHKPGERVTLTVLSPAGHEEQELTIELGEHPDEEGVAYLGVTYLSAPPARMGRFPPPDDWRPLPDPERFRYLIPHGHAGVVVIDVDADSPADEAGLREGDFILEIEGEAVETPQDVVRAVARRNPGDELTLTIGRRGEEGDGDQEQGLELSVTLGEHPDDADRAYLGVRLGLGGEWEHEGWHPELDLPEDWRPKFDLPEEWHWEFRLPEAWILPFDLEELPHDFKFDFWPGDEFDEQEALRDDASA